MAASQDLIDSVANENNKVGAGGPAFWLNLGMSDAVSHQRTVNAIRETGLEMFTKRAHEIDITESVAAQKTLSGNDLAQQIAQLAAAVASIQASIKGAGNIPPVTPKA